MTVAELIDNLQAFPPDETVAVVLGIYSVDGALIAVDSNEVFKILRNYTQEAIGYAPEGGGCVGIHATLTIDSQMLLNAIPDSPEHNLN